MRTEKQNVDWLIDSIFQHSGLAFNRRKGTIGEIVFLVRGGNFTPPTWPKFDDHLNGDSARFYGGILTTAHLCEWLEHLSNLNRGDPEPDMFWCAGDEYAVDGEEEFAQRVLDEEEMDRFESVIVVVNCAKRLKDRKMEIVEDYDGSVKSWKWVK